MELIVNAQKTASELAQAEEELLELRRKVLSLRKKQSAQSVEDYVLADTDGKEVHLSSLFGDKQDLMLIHNMGKSCPYCTLWADGINGVYQHLQDRAALALVSPDPPETVKQFCQGRDWKFAVYSNNGGPFTSAMGYEDEKGNPHPGMSTFHRDDGGNISRISHTPFGPGDEFCAVWHMLDMLKDGPADWQPKYKY